MDKKNEIFKKTLVIGILILFVGSVILPSIAGDNSRQDTTTITFYTFDKTGTKKCKTDLSNEIANEISEIFEELKIKITKYPLSDETKSLKYDFIDLLDAYGLIPQKVSKDYLVSLLNPWWLKFVEGGSPFTRLRGVGSEAGGGVLPGPLGYRGSAFFCGVAGYGAGVMFLPVMAPRPRLATFWSSLIYAGSYATNLFTGRGFIAYGAQFGSALGFMGIGLSFVYPGVPALFSFYGYALFARVTAEDVETYPPNQKPVVSGENPSSGTWDVPLSLSELSFSISDADFDRMSYWVTTDPDIGSGQGHLKGNGVYSIPVSGLEIDKQYSWTVSVSDGTVTVEKSFGFFTEGRSPFDPFDEGWKYRKKITINHSQVAGGLSDFPVLVSLVDPDLVVKAQVDGDDILFMDGSGVAKKVYHEIELFNGSSGELVAWVRIPSLSSTVDTDFYLYYGNPSCSVQQFPGKVWDSNYVAVWHMDGNNYMEFDDSTVNHFDATNDGGNPTYQYTAKIGEGVKFDGVNDEILISDDDKFYFSDSSGDKPCSFEAWIKTNYGGPIITKFMKDVTGGWLFNVPSTDKCKLYFYDNINFCSIGMSTETSVTTNSWIHVATTYDGSTNYQGMTAYLNGNVDNGYGYTRPSYNHMGNSNTIVRIGRYSFETPYFFEGIIDEIRISNVEHSSAFIETSYNTMNDPSNFFSVGPEESVP